MFLRMDVEKSLATQPPPSSTSVLPPGWRSFQGGQDAGALEIPYGCGSDVSWESWRGLWSSHREEEMAAAGPVAAVFQELVLRACWVISVGPAALWKVFTFTLP